MQKEKENERGEQNSDLKISGDQSEFAPSTIFLRREVRYYTALVGIYTTKIT